MAIVGHGVDLVEVARIERLLREHPGRFASRCFTPTELTIAGGGPTRAERLAGRFAAKEAVLKALGTGLRDGIEWTQIEVAQADSGAPMLRLSGHAQRASEALGARAWWVSISHTAGFAVASAIAEGG
ncbi:MAG TPA: holo-[acyl-carrier-protein] synthase [Phycisphaerales bacterium]|nr:holo-[acyl-carrier-protein] synthase [Phycisphaerales bacterium]